MQATAIIDTSPTQTSESQFKMHAVDHQAALKWQSRVMTVTNLSLSIPPETNAPTNIITNSQTSNETLAPGEVVAMEEASVSDKSSICRSPGWDDMESKKRRKAKQEAKDQRRREQEKATTKAKKQRPPKRLTKPPPTTRGISKLSTPIPRSESAPVVQTLSGSLNVKGKPESSGGRTSIDSGPRRSTPWKSAISRTVDETQTQRSMEGFIGGLKLQQATQAAVQETIRKQKAPVVDRYMSKFAEEFAAADLDGETTNRNLKGGGLNSASSSTHLESFTDDQILFSDRMSRSPEDCQQEPGELAPTPESIIQQAQAHTTEITSEISLVPASKLPTKDRNFPRFSQPSSALSSERPPISYREPPQLAGEEHGRTRRGSFRFMRSQRQSSQDRSANTSQDESRASIATSTISTEWHAQGRRWSFYKGSRTSSSRPTTADSVTSNGSKDNSLDHTSLSDSHGVPAATLGTAVGSKEGLKLNRNFSRPTPLKDLQSAAKAAFSRHSYSPKSPPTNPDSNETHRTKGVRQTSVNPLSSDYVSHCAPQLPSKAERLPPEIGYKIDRHNLEDHSSGQTWTDKSKRSGKVVGCGDGNLNDDAHLSPKHDRSNDQSSNSSSLNDSSDEYHSIFDESTSASTPVASRPRPEKHNLTNGNLRGDISADTAVHNGSSVPSGEHGRRAQSSIPEEQESKSLHTTSCSRDSSANPEPTTASSKSSSSSDLQDLSFLPTLRHQPLARPAKDKGKEISSPNYSEHLTMNSATTLTRPPFPTPPSGSSTSPTSPTIYSAHSAQYLQNARQHLPPPASNSRPSLHSMSSQESNALAKMFVICCHCRYFHDMPSKIYECMTKPDNVVTDRDLGVSGVISMAVKCPWCGHGMSTRCCEGWAAAVVLRERLH